MWHFHFSLCCFVLSELLLCAPRLLMPSSILHLNDNKPFHLHPGEGLFQTRPSLAPVSFTPNQFKIVLDFNSLVASWLSGAHPDLICPKGSLLFNKSKPLLLTLLSHSCIEITQLCLSSCPCVWQRYYFR